MKVGDILVFTNDNGYGGQYYTEGKHYTIFKIENFANMGLCGWIRDDQGGKTYFTENEAEDKNWKYLKTIRKNKLKKIENSKCWNIK
jgi:hypothetical protein